MTATAERHSLVDKARAIKSSLSRLRRYAADSQANAEAAETAAAGARRLTELAMLRENLARVELTSALQAALVSRDEVTNSARRRVLAEFLMRGPAGRVRRRGRPVRWQEQVAARLGASGQAWVATMAGVRGSILFDAAWYLQQNPDVAAQGVDPLTHYLLAGSWELRAPHPLFDEAAYRTVHAAELAATGVSSLEHYLAFGAWRGASPHPLFDVGHYLLQASPAAGEDPLSHYVRLGWREGLSPHPLFDPAWYVAQVADGFCDEPPLSHYLRLGWRAGCSPHPLFDPAWYRETYPEFAGTEPLTEFLLTGAAAGRSPSAWFDLRAYVAERGSAAAVHANPLVDYLWGGAWAIAEATPGVATAAYLAARPSLARRGLTPLEHWARQAVTERRTQD